MLNDKKNFVVILFSSILLGIWATAGTIALRNILLISLAALSIHSVRTWFNDYRGYWMRGKPWRSDFLCWLPSILILLMIIWVVLHYIFFSKFHDWQWDELTSTWLRAFMAAIIGFGCAIALRRSPTYASLLWFGLIVSFLVLIIQYIPKAIANRSFFAPDYGYYIYRAKFNGVLAGVMLFAGTLGLIFDSMRHLSIASNTKFSEDSHPLNNKIIQVFIILGLLLPPFSFVFIFNSKNGIGVLGILFTFWLMVGGIYYFHTQFFKKNTHHQLGQKSRKLKAVYFLLILMFSWFFYLQTKINPGWESLIEDIRISSQIDLIQNWKDPTKYGYPNRSDGSNVAGNTYERIAWGLVGLRIIIDKPLGNGVFRSFSDQLQQVGINFDSSVYTHSAWIDLGLSFGLPGILFIPIALFLCMIACTRKYCGDYRATVTSLAISFLVLYLVGEYAFQHGIEILFFISTFLAVIIQPDPKIILDRYSGE